MILFLTATLALTIFLITGDALLPSLLAYLLAARPSSRSAVWLRRVDPVEARGRVCFWFYLATAGWQAAAAGLLTIVIALVASNQLNIGPDLTSLNHALLTVVCGVSGATILGWLGIYYAWRARVRVFVVPSASKLCGEDFLELVPATSTRQRWNYGLFVVACSTVVPPLVAGTLVAAVAGLAEGRGDWTPAATGIGLGLIMLSPLVTIPLCSRIADRTLAASPADCWLWNA